MTSASDELSREIAALLPRLRRFGRALTRHREDADDLAQVAVERALQRTHQFERGTRLDSWLFRIMQNAWIDELRARSRRGETSIDEAELEQLPASGTPDDALAVRRAVERLHDDHRAAVALVLIEGLSYQEAAGVLGVPIGTLTSRLARAREALQAMLEPTMEAR
jgi:RNA polymerase sigma-70 factor (ECF subfamily)